MAEVFLANSRGPVGFNKLVVIKELRTPDQPGFVEMFLDEARLAARLNHPNIVHTFEVGEWRGSYFMAMEYLEGQPLNKVARQEDASDLVSQPMWARIVAEALRGLHHAHELRDYDGTPLEIVHRDISPHNIFVTYSGEVKLVDFGIAKATLNSSQTEAGVLKGKLSYMAPEQLAGSVDRRSDVFSMGVVLWEVLTGQRLFKGDTAQILHTLMHEAVPPISSVRADASSALEAIVARATARAPAQRYASADDMREALESYVRGCGEEMTAQHIGRVMSALFEEVRASVQRQVQSHMAGVNARRSASEIAVLKLSGSHSSAGEFDPTSITPSESPRALKRLSAQSAADPFLALREAEARRASLLPVQLATAAPPKPPRSRAFALSAAAFTLLAFGGVVGALAMRKLEPHASVVVRGPPIADFGVVELTTEPPDAVVEWNGRAMGRTPARFELPAGGRTLALSKEGYLTETVTLDLPAGQVPLTRSFTLHAREPQRAPPPLHASLYGSPMAPRAGDVRAPAPKSAPPSMAVRPRPPAPRFASSPPPGASAPSSATASERPAKLKVRVIDDEETTTKYDVITE